MTRKSLLASLTIIGVLAGLVGLTLTVLVRHEPESYARAAVPPGAEREANSEAFEKKLWPLVDDIRFQSDWEEEFTEAQINSYLAEDFLKQQWLQLPAEIRDPRVVLRPGQLIIGFRYGSGEVNSVVTVHAKVWLPRREPNVVALEIEQLRAGAIPIAIKVLQDELTEAARKQRIDIQWYRHEGNPVAVVRFQADRREPAFQLRELDLRQGSIYVKGRTHDIEIPDPDRIAIPTAGKPSGSLPKPPE